MTDDGNDPIGILLGLGVIAYFELGFYRVLISYGSLKKDEIISSADLISRRELYEEKCIVSESESAFSQETINVLLRAIIEVVQINIETLQEIEEENEEEKILRECREAEARGERVCWKCMLINPPECVHCSNCMKCTADDGGGVCCECGD